MSISIGTDGRVVTGRTNVVIPPENAGVGDLIFRSAAGVNKVIGRGTASASTITIDGTTYTLHGCIIGFVAGMSMICAPTEASKQWATSNSVTLPAETPFYGIGTLLMRNGQKTAEYVQMNTAANASSIFSSGVAQNEPLASAFHATGLASSASWDSTGVTNPDILMKYSSYADYIRQTLRVNAAVNTPFGARISGVNVHQFGRWMTRKLYATSTTDFPAATYCMEYTVANTGDAAGNWHMPSMYELGELMIDENVALINTNSSVMSAIRTDLAHLSCVLRSSSICWYYRNTGASDGGYLSYALAVRPIRYLKLT